MRPIVHGRSGPYETPRSPYETLRSPYETSPGSRDVSRGPYGAQSAPYEAQSGPQEVSRGPYGAEPGSYESRSGPYAAQSGSYEAGSYEAGSYEAGPGRRQAPSAWGRPPEPPPRPGEGRPEPRGRRAAAPGALDAYSGRSGPLATEQTDSRDSGGVEVRLGGRARQRERARQARRRTEGRGILVAVGVLVLAGLVTIGLVLTPESGDGDGAQAGEARPNLENVEPPPAGEPLELDTADGFRYRIAAVGSGLNEEAVTASQTSLPSGTSYPYIDYLLTNPTDQEVLLEYPGDIFVKRDLVTADAQERCEPQGGAPEDWCTPPTESEVVQRLAGGELVPGAGGDKYMPPGSTYLVRITTQVPVDGDVTSEDMSLYVWNQIFMGTEPAKQVPFPG